MPDQMINMDVGSERAENFKSREKIDHFARFKPDSSTPHKLGNTGKKSSNKTSSIDPYNNDSISAQIGLGNAEKLTHDKANEMESSGGYASHDVILDDYDEETLNTAGSGSMSSHELLFMSVVFHRLFDNVTSSLCQICIQHARPCRTKNSTLGLYPLWSDEGWRCSSRRQMALAVFPKLRV